MLFPFRLYPPFCVRKAGRFVVALFGPSRSRSCFTFISIFSDEDKSIPTIETHGRRCTAEFLVTLKSNWERRACACVCNIPLPLFQKKAPKSSYNCEPFTAIIISHALRLFGSFSGLSGSTWKPLPLSFFFLNKWGMNEDIMWSKDTNCCGSWGETIGETRGWGNLESIGG